MRQRQVTEAEVRQTLDRPDRTTTDSGGDCHLSAGEGRVAVRITYDPRADALAIELRDVPVARTCEVTDAINVDLGKDGRAVVVEILNVRKGLGDEVLQQVGLDLGGVRWQPEQDTVYATDEAARLVGVSRQYLSKMARESKIPARRSGRDWLFYRSGLVEFFGPARVREQPTRYRTRAAAKDGATASGRHGRRRSSSDRRNSRQLSDRR